MRRKADRQEKTIRIYATEGEAETLRAAAREAGMQLSPWLRQAALLAANPTHTGNSGTSTTVTVGKIKYGSR